MTKSFSDRVNEELREFCKSADDFPWQNPDAYAEWLGQAWYFVRHATRLLSLTASKFDLDRNELHNRFLDHLREERGHDVMLVRDLKALGREVKDFPERPETAALYQVQYYWIEHVDPIAFFGYILCLEGVAVSRGRQIYETVCKVHGEKAGLFLKVHSNEDEEHYAKALKQLSKISEREQKWVLENMALSRGLYANMFAAIKAGAVAVPSNKLKRAA
ncbi:MAG: iron-containing redox enzyme family protein [Bdellovibrionia bacterium]